MRVVLCSTLLTRKPRIAIDTDIHHLEEVPGSLSQRVIDHINSVLGHFSDLTQEPSHIDRAKLADIHIIVKCDRQHF